jgi:hypothetical protein
LPTANTANHKWLGLPLTLLDQEIARGAQDFFTPYIFRDTLSDMRTGVIGMDEHFAMTGYIPKSRKI